MQLTDSFGRVHDYLRISLTDHCNLRCTYCMPEEVVFTPNEKLMSADEIFRLAEIFVSRLGVKKIRITGGEPLARKDAGEIIRSLARLPANLGITTNGILLDRYFEDLKTAGIKSINLSLDTFDKEKFKKITRRDAFDAVLKNYHAALELGFRIKLNMVVMRGNNDNEILRFIEETRHPQVHVRFIEFMPFEGNHWQWNQVISYREMLEQIQASCAVEKLADEQHSTSKAWRVKTLPGTFAVISTVSEHFCGDCNRIRLTADGKLRNCLFATEETDLLSAFRKGEDVETLIRAGIAAKKAKLGGLPEFQDETLLNAKLSARSMVKIGG